MSSIIMHLPKYECLCHFKIHAITPDPQCDRIRILGAFALLNGTQPYSRLQIRMEYK